MMCNAQFFRYNFDDNFSVAFSQNFTISSRFTISIYGAKLSVYKLDLFRTKDVSYGLD